MSSRDPLPKQAPQTVFVVDDDDAVRKALRLMLLTSGHQVETFSSATELLQAMETTRPGCLVSDVRMPGMDGMELLKVLAERDATLPVVMLSAHGDIPMAVDAMKTGAVEFLEKPADPDVLRRKVVEALARNAAALSDHHEQQEIRQHLATLTPREKQVLDYLADGKDAHTIAQIFGSSHNTVRVQRASIMKKMRADNLADLVKMLNRIAGTGNSDTTAGNE